jgi:exonuclease VII large subunit
MTQAASLDPVRVVRAGYAIVRGADGRPLSTAAAIVTEGKVVAQMKDGTVALIVPRGK